MHAEEDPHGATHWLIAGRWHAGRYRFKAPESSGGYVTGSITELKTEPRFKIEVAGYRPGWECTLSGRFETPDAAAEEAVTVYGLVPAPEFTPENVRAELARLEALADTNPERAARHLSRFSCSKGVW